MLMSEEIQEVCQSIVIPEGIGGLHRKDEDVTQHVRAMNRYRSEIVRVLRELGVSVQTRDLQEHLIELQRIEDETIALNEAADAAAAEAQASTSRGRRRL